jgi:hypothetical protein
METITVTRTIAAPIDDVFAWYATTSNWERSGWVLRNRLTRPGTEAPYGVGAVRTHLWLIGWFREQVTRYEPPFAVEYVVERCVPPARHDGGSTTFTSVAGGTRVTWSTTVEVRIPLAAGIITRVAVKPLLTWVFGRILRAGAKELATAPRAAAGAP